MTTAYTQKRRREAVQALTRANQKAARLEAAHRISEGLLKHQGQKLHELREEMADAKKLIGPLSAILHPQISEIPGKARATVLAADSVPVNLSYEPGAAIDMTFSSVPLDVLVASVSEEQMRGLLHANVQFGDSETLCYSASRSTVRAMPTERFIREVAGNIAHQLARSLAGKGLLDCRSRGRAL